LKNFVKNTVVIVGGSAPINYLIRRYAERMGYSVEAMSSTVAASLVCDLSPIATIFPSLEILEACQQLVAGLANCDIPIIVCSTPTDQLRTRELGADYCLLHPLGYDNFCDTLATVAALQASGRVSDPD
jgi:CheY-like chemotaxis protein